MERLTRRELLNTSIGEFVGCNIEIGQMNSCPECNDSCMYGRCKWQEKANQKLKEYEDLEEQGLLLKLPCKVGDVLFNIENGEIESFVVEEFRICTYKIDRIEIYFENASGFGLCLFDGTLDEGWYKTLAEAEKALKKALAEMEK